MAAASALAEEPGFTRALLARRSVLAALCVFLLILAAVLLATWIAPADPAAMAVRQRLSPPGTGYLLGSDPYGRDVFSRLLFAGRVSLTVGAGVAMIASVGGILIGLVAGYFPRLDAPASRIIDAMMAFPDILLAIALVAILGGSIANVIIALSIVYTPRIARTVRASTLVIRELPYVEAARALGSSTPFILIQHILRNILSPIIVQATFIFAVCDAGGSGVVVFWAWASTPSTPSWGTMINEGRQYVDQAPFLIFFPGIAIAASVLCLQLIGDGLRDALDPRIARQL